MLYNSRNIRSQIPLRMFTYFAVFFGILSAYIIVGLHACQDPSIIKGDGSISYQVKQLVSQISGLGSILQIFPTLMGSIGLLAGLVHRVGEALESLEHAIEKKRKLDMSGTRVCYTATLM
jgi:hypothetical protein